MINLFILSCFLILCPIGAQLFDQDIFRTPHEIIESRGFRYEDHHVITGDGYNLTLWRLINPRPRYPRKKYPVIFWHGIRSNGKFWLITNPGRLDEQGVYRDVRTGRPNDCATSLTSNLPFTLSACGYDVWVGNNRGSRYSWTHIRFSRYSQQYWNYTQKELALYDIKNSVEYVLRTTRTTSLSYIGHSQGTTQMFILLSVQPSFERHINLFGAFAPVVFIGNFYSSVQMFVPIVPLFNNVKIGLGLPYYINTIMAIFADLNPVINSIINMQDLGPNPTYQKPASSATIADFTSSRSIIHFGQWVLSGKFAEFNYLNARKNMQVYGKTTPRDFPIEKIASRNMVFCVGKTDYYMDTKDMNRLLSRLTVKLREFYLVNNTYFNHNDYLYSPNTYNTVNPVIFKHLAQVNGQ